MSRLEKQRAEELLGRGERVQFLHQTRFAAGGIVFLNDAFLRGLIECADRLLDRFRGFSGAPTLDRLVRILDFGARLRANDTVANTAAFTLTHCFFSRSCVCQLDNLL